MSIPTGAFTRTNSFGNDPRKAYARFFTASVQDDLASTRAARPIFREVERVEFILPGNPHTRPVKNVDDEIRRDYAKEYELFRAGKEAVVEGTPLEEWPILNKGQVEELKYLKIYTIEQCAGLDDLSIQRIGMGGRDLVQRAKMFLSDAERIAGEEALRARNDLLESKLAAQQTQIDELTRLYQNLHSENIDLRAAPNPITQVAPMHSDPMAASAEITQATTDSALASLAKPRRGRPPKVA